MCLVCGLGGVSLGPQLGYSVVFLPVGGVLRGDAADEGVRRVAVGQEGADREEDLGDGQGGTPVVLEDVQTNDALRVDVAVVNARAEGHLGRLEGVLGREVDVQEEDAALVHRTRRTQNGRHPLVNVVPLRTRAERINQGMLIIQGKALSVHIKRLSVLSEVIDASNRYLRNVEKNKVSLLSGLHFKLNVPIIASEVM